MLILRIIYLSVVIGVFIIGLTLGSDLLTSSILAIISLSAVLAIKDNMSVADVIYLIYVFYAAFATLVFKAIVQQPIQSNLIAPQESAFVLLASSAAVLTAYLLINLINVFRPLNLSISSPLKDNNFIKFFSVFSYCLGFIFMLLHYSLRPQFIDGVNALTQGTGAFGTFYFLILFGFAAQIYVWSISSNKNFSFVISVAMLIGFVFLSIAGNAKRTIYDALFIIALSYPAYRLKLSIPTAIAAVLGAIVLNFVISPIIQVVRVSSGEKTISARIDASVEIISENLNNLGKLNQMQRGVAKGFAHQFRPNETYFYPSTIAVDRYVLLMPLDQVIREKGRGYIPDAVAYEQTLTRILPSVILPKTASAALPDEIAWKYGFRTYGVVSYPVMGLPTSSYAVWGLSGAIIIPFLLYSVLFLICHSIAGFIRGNPLAIGFAATLTTTAEMTLDSFAGFITRDMLIMLTTIAIIFVAYGLIPKTQTPFNRGKL
jgi:hypothetical protein